MPVGVSREYLDRAHFSLRQAEDCYRQLDWPLCIVRAAECVEFSLKGILQAVGAPYRQEHEVSGYLITVHEHFPEWFRDKLPRIGLISRTLTQLFLFAKYGDEALRAPPKRLFQRAEATAYLENAKEVYWGCDRLFWELEMRQGSGSKG